MSDLDELYMSRRLAITQRAQDLTPSMQVDLASSGLSNSELNEAVQHFNPTPQQPGWGFSNIFEELMSRDPRKVPTSDLQTLQQNLVNQGYLPPDHPVDGTWGPDSAAAFGQFDRDNADSVRQGNSLISGTIQDGINLFAKTLPRSVVQGVIGTAKGLYQQTGETLERGGLLGGAAEGAAIGAVAGNAIPIPGVGAGIGAAVGAVAGGIAGFLSSLAGDDNDADKSVLDALHPFNHGEWTSAQHFFEDLGYVASAASLIEGAGVAVKGAAALAPSTLKGSLLALDPVTKPGFVANMLGSARGSALLGGVVGGAHGMAAGDDFGDVFEQAAIGAGAGYVVGASPVGKKLRDLAATYGLKRIGTNPVIRGVNAVYTGGVMANVGGRYAGGLGSGEEDTALEKSIREAPVVLPEWADVVGGMVLLPERVLPLNLAEVGSAARSLMGDTRLMPYYHALETAKDAAGNVLSKKEVNRALDALREDPVRDLYMREQFGIEQLTKWSLDSQRADREAFVMHGGSERIYGDARNEIMDWYKTDTESKYPLIMALSTEDPLEYSKYLVGLEKEGSGFRQWDRFEPAQTKAEQLSFAAQRGEVDFKVKGGSIVDLDRGITRAEAQIERLKAVPDQTPQVIKRLKKEEENLSALKLRRSAVRTKEDVRFVAANPDYMTSGDWNNAADEYTRLVQEKKRAWDAAMDIDITKLPDQARTARAAAVQASEELEAFIRSFHDPNISHRYLPQSLIDDALATTEVGRKDKRFKFADFLREKAAHAGADVDIDPSLIGDITSNGYKLVATGDDMRFLSEVRQLAEKHNVGDYTKRAAFFEAAGMSPFAVTEKEVGRLKGAHLNGELNRAADELGLSISGDDIMHKLSQQQEKFNNLGRREGPFVIQPGERSLVRRTKLIQQDLRQMDLQNIVEGIGLDEGFLKVDDPMRAAQRIKDAIHKGSAFGAEVSIKNPIDTTRMLASAMRVEGLTGFSDFMRQFHITNPPRALAVAGGVAGAGVGYSEDGWEGALKGGIAGSLALGGLGYGGRKALAKWPAKSPFRPGTYGWLPNNLHNAAMALRYSLSFTFDLGRRMEQASIASMEFGAPVILAPKSYALRHFSEDFGGQDNVMTGLRSQLDEVMGSKVAMNADDMDRRASAVGLTGFSQRDADAVYAHLFIKSGKMNRMQVRDAVHKLGHYPPRTGFERSLNFVLFPFSFQKKLITTLGDFMLAEPARALMVHEGMRQWYRARTDGSLSEKMNEFNEKYLPLADQIARLNNLSYGISPGRFFLEGLIGDKSENRNRTLLGKVSQGLASVFVPSGAVTPLQQAAGHVGDQLVNFFSPIFLTGEDTENFYSIFEDFAPAVRDARNIMLGYGANKPSVLSQQFTAFTERGATDETGSKTGGGAPWYQYRHFTEERRQLKMQYEDLASALGYSTVDGFLNSDMGAPYKAQVEQETLALAEKYPTGAAKSQYFETSTLTDDRAKAELFNKPNRSIGEEMIVQLLEMENESEQLGQMLGMSTSDMFPRLQQNVREIATKFGNDIRFRELYDRWFGYRYGPIMEVAA